MFAVADTDQLVADRVIDAAAAREIEARARDTMVTLAINAVLCFGIVAATGGLIFWLADALSVAIVGALMLGGGLLILARTGALYAMFGNAAALIGAGMLIGGAGIELTDKYPDIAGWIMLAGGLIPAAIAARALLKGGLTARFVAGSIGLMGVALHLTGLGWLLSEAQADGWPVALAYLYAAALIALAGWITDVRIVTALAIVPFAQALDTGTFYFHAVYAFYSPEPTLSIVQMAALIVAALWLAARVDERTARHARVTAVMAFIVANLCALVGSLWGDVVGETLWSPGLWYQAEALDDYDGWLTASEVFRASSLTISEDVFSVLWAIALAAIIAYAAHRANRGLFNAAMTFAAIHAYTQMFESFSDEPLAYVIGGLAAIPLAWGMWRLNARFLARSSPEPV